jgi:hypothetical protein
VLFHHPNPVCNQVCNHHHILVNNQTVPPRTSPPRDLLSNRATTQAVNHQNNLRTGPADCHQHSLLLDRVVHQLCSLYRRLHVNQVVYPVCSRLCNRPTDPARSRLLSQVVDLVPNLRASRLTSLPLNRLVSPQVNPRGVPLFSPVLLLRVSQVIVRLLSPADGPLASIQVIRAANPPSIHRNSPQDVPQASQAMSPVVSHRPNPRISPRRNRLMNRRVSPLLALLFNRQLTHQRNQVLSPAVVLRCSLSVHQVRLPHLNQAGFQLFAPRLSPAQSPRVVRRNSQQFGTSKARCSTIDQSRFSLKSENPT